MRAAAFIVALAGVTASLFPALVAAASVGQLVARAESYGMTCTPSATDVSCDLVGTQPFGIHAVIEPRSGHETSLLTRASRNGTIPGGGLDTSTRKWMADLQTLACGAPVKVAAFVDSVADLTKNGSVPSDTIGDCRFDGNMKERSLTAGGDWFVQSVYIPPPTPEPTKRPPKPTPPPTPTPSPTAAPTATPSPAPSPAPSPTPAATIAVAPSPTPPAPSVATPSPTADPGAGSGATPAPSLTTFSQSVLAISDVNADVAAVGGSFLLALLLLLLIAFAGELFNNTIENNYGEIAGWLRKRPLDRVGGWFRGHGRLGVILFIALTALISSFVDPAFGFDLRSLAEFLGFLVGLVVVLASFKLPPMLAHRRKTGDLGRLRPLPWALVVAVLFVIVSRIGNLQPGYLYGIVLGAIFMKDVSDTEEGRGSFYGALWTLGAALVAWLGLGWVRSLGLAEDGFGVTLLSTAFAATLVAGLEAAAFGLMPMRFLPGHAVYKWNRLGWALTFGLSVFAFVHILIGPTSGYVYDLSPTAFSAALGVFAAFGTLSIATWLFFRVRSTRRVAWATSAQEGLEPGDGLGQVQSAKPDAEVGVAEAEGR